MGDGAEFGRMLLPFLGVFALGVGVGALALRLTRGARRAQQLATELSHAREELREAREQLDRQKEAVTKHFGQTSELFRDLTRQYTALYAHLAEGARDLCPDAPIPLGQGLDGPLLGEGPPPAEHEPEPAGSPDRQTASA